MTEPFLPPGGRAWDRLFRCEAEDGTRLRAAVWNPGASRGHVIFLSGRTEFLEKVALPAAEFVERGFGVASIDWRGQGLSDRLAQPALKGHIEDFLQYHQDLASLLSHPEVVALQGPRIVLGHSMGGAIALGALIRRRIAAEALVLSAPLMGIRLSRTMRWASVATVAIARAIGRLDRWPPFGDMASPYVFLGFDDNVLTSDEAVFGWMVEALRREPGLQLAMPTIGWMAAATRECRLIARHGRLGLPTLCLLGSEEKVVEPDAVRRGAARLGAELVEIEGARHEVLIERPEIRAKAWSAIDRFLEAQRF